MALDYSILSRKDFDVVVTGELTHLCLHLELEVNKFITDYFLYRSSRKMEFGLLILYRECLSFQEKIDIIKSLVNIKSSKLNKAESNFIISKMEKIKSLRNTLAHGFQTRDDESDEIKIIIETYGRTGNIKRTIITPINHQEIVDDFELFFAEVVKWRKKTIKILNSKS